MTVPFDHSKIIHELAHNGETFETLLKNVPAEMIHWKQTPEKWSLLEIVCHLYDEECDDFRARTKNMLETPTEKLKPIDPPGWVISRQYMNQDYAKRLNDFLAERRASVHWLKSLQNPQWQNGFVHPKAGLLTAKVFLTNWLAHDYLHMKQILKLKFDYLSQSCSEDLNYAGSW